ncbi:wall-associated receptor kinase-like 8 isoform X2 [Gossypium australe]|uniref:Wall-associated receptor kinase-like 8 isoform X2 n=1 Tax=Gossypium australe TaxID=47621 RepID=A0A5B6WG16_9ROSI|nr:wall-associated receptor kinase-like 8 isoform X2 [Gossypium australe]
MGFHLWFYFILLIFLFCPTLQAAEPQQAICGEEVCGNITIPSPFGIHRTCYTLPFFRVTCKQIHNQKKPFIRINGLDLELLGSLFQDTILINNPVTYVNCDHKNEVASATVNLTGTPFFFSSDYNNFASVGCGNLVTIFRNEADAFGGCVQTICGDGASESGCSNTISGNFTSTIVNMTPMYPIGKDHRKRCSSAVIFSRLFFREAYPLPIGINIETTHVPTTLSWDSSYCGDAGCAPGPGPISFIGEKSCGNVSFQYPFEIIDQEYTNGWFRVICKKTSNGRTTPFLNINGVNLPILDFSFLYGKVVVNHSITYFNCRKNSNNGMSLNLTRTPFYYSDFDNIFWSSGCGNLATVFDSETGNLVGGCLQPSCRISNETSSVTGCSFNIPHGLASFSANMSGRVDSSNYSRKSSCGFASLIQSDLYYGLTSESKDFDVNYWTYVPTSLQWSTPMSGLCHLRQGINTNCSSNRNYCWQRLSPTHLCVCNKDFGLGDTSTYCKGENCGIYVWCHMLCLNTPGNYCSSRNCPPGYKYNSTGVRCEPDENTSQAPPKNTRSLTIIIIGCSTSIGTIFLLLGLWKMYEVVKRRRNILLKQKYFKRNGGLLLQQHLSSNTSYFETIKMFTSKEIEKATDYYNENRILGRGGQGTVYKGMLTDGSIVAVKKSKIEKGKKFGEKKVEQFINEVIILSQINHRNVVKLSGCCLEAETPLLVYEFIPNGTLYDLIHGQNEELPLTWEMRLRIATEIANALFYLHSAASVSIYHRDVKSSNILLDDKYKAKVSDFGTSRSIALEQTHLTTLVQGTFGYMDPEYFRSNQFTEKSDVYSFGVVLVELLTGEKPISSKQSDEERSLVSLFLLSMQENSLSDILDSKVANDGPEKEIIAVAKLAKRCLNLNGKKRPTMKQVAMELELIKASEEGNAIEESGDEESEVDDMIESWDINPSCPMSRSVATDSVILPLNESF